MGTLKKLVKGISLFALLIFGLYGIIRRSFFFFVDVLNKVQRPPVFALNSIESLTEISFACASLPEMMMRRLAQNSLTTSAAELPILKRLAPGKHRETPMYSLDGSANKLWGEADNGILFSCLAVGLPRTSARSVSSFHRVSSRSQQSHLSSLRPLPVRPWAAAPRRSLFIQTENTPNPSSLKFLPGREVLSPSVSTGVFLQKGDREYQRSPLAVGGWAARALSALRPQVTSTVSSPMLPVLNVPSTCGGSQARLFKLEGVTSVFLGADFVTVGKTPEEDWVALKPQIFSLLMDAFGEVGASLPSCTQTTPRAAKLPRYDGSFKYLFCRRWALRCGSTMGTQWSAIRPFLMTTTRWLP